MSGADPQRSGGSPQTDLPGCPSPGSYEAGVQPGSHPGSIHDQLRTGPGLPAVQRLEIEVTWSSILRVLGAVLLVYVVVLLWPIVKALILAVLAAVALYPLVQWVVRRGWPEWVGHLLAGTVLLTLVVGCLCILGPLIFRQAAALGDNLPRLRDQIISQLPASGPIHQALQNSMSPGTVADSRLLLQKALVMIELTLGGLVGVVVVVALAIYLIIDGPRTLHWLLLFVPVAERDKVSETLAQVSRLVSAYVMGQFLISLLCALYLTIVLTVLGVPMAFTLGVVAGICDVLPIIGFFITVFLAMTIGFSVSPMTALLIFLLYGAYHLFENLYILPRVYGRKLKLSKLAVPLAVAAGGLLAGGSGSGGGVAHYRGLPCGGSALAGTAAESARPEFLRK